MIPIYFFLIIIYLYNLTNIINIGLLNLSDWFKANKQSLNIKKSNYIIFIIFRQRQKRQITSLPLYKNDHELHRTDHVVFLGVILDEHLSWSLHISHIAGKIARSVGIIYRARFFLTKVVLRTLYTIHLSILTYNIVQHRGVQDTLPN